MAKAKQYNAEHDRLEHRAHVFRKVELQRAQEYEADQDLRSLTYGDPRSLLSKLEG